MTKIFCSAITAYPDDANCFFLRDWYFFAVEDDEGLSYGLVLLVPNREVNNGECRVGLPFVELNNIVFSTYSVETKASIKEALYEVTNCNESSIYSNRLLYYFMNDSAQANYLLAERYVNIVINEEMVDNKITAVLPGTDSSVYRDDVLEKYNIFNNIEGVYNPTENAIIVSDQNCQKISVIQCILVCRTNNPSMNSFAAEICYHAEYGYWSNYNLQNNPDPIGDLFWIYAIKKHAIKADLNLNKENAEWEAEKYKKYDGIYTTRQRMIFGDF